MSTDADLKNSRMVYYAEDIKELENCYPTMSLRFQAHPLHP